MSDHKLTITLDHETMQRLERYSKRWDLSAPLTGAKLVYVGLQRSDALTDWGEKVRAERGAKPARAKARTEALKEHEARVRAMEKTKAKPKAEKPAPKVKPVAKPKPTKAKAAKVVKPKAEKKPAKPVAMTLAEAGMAEPARAAEPVLTKAEVAEAMAAETPAEPASAPVSKYLDVKVGDKIFDCDPRRQAEKVVTKVMPDHLYIQLPGNQGVVSSVSRESVHTDRTKKKGYALVLA